MKKTNEEKPVQNDVDAAKVAKAVLEEQAANDVKMCTDGISTLLGTYGCELLFVETKVNGDLIQKDFKVVKSKEN